MDFRPLTVLVLGGGPDREREVSLKSAASVAAALRAAGHNVLESDIGPGQLGALALRFDVVFPVLHGRWGEGGELQRVLDARDVRYVGSRARAAHAAMDKCASKQAAERHGVPTPPYQLLGPLTPLAIHPPLVIKPLTEGSSFGVDICHDAAAVDAARVKLHRHFAFGLAEQFVRGCEVTVGVLDGQVLPPIKIVPAAAFYDFQAKYDRDDTRYDFDTGLSAATLETLGHHALVVYQALDCRHLARVDFIVDEGERPWFLEINTLPGFTDHSLLPKAAAKAGYDMPRLCDKLVRLAMRG